MKVLKYFFWIIWRSWFYVVVTSLVLLLLPLLLVFTAHQRWYPAFYRVVRQLWATPILYAMGFYPGIRRAPAATNDHHSYMLVANHYGMMDTMLVLYCSKDPFVFIGKKELAKLSLFGYFYKRAVILVDRKNSQSRREVYKHVLEWIQSGLSICIFPEGDVPDDESIVLDNFKDSTFRIVIQCQIPIVPMVLYDTKKRLPFHFFTDNTGRIRVDILPPISTEGKALDDRDALREEVHSLILQRLTAAAPGAPHTSQ